MRVLILGNYSRNLVVFRGALIRELVRRGHEVLAVGPERDNWTSAELRRMGARFEAVPMARASIIPFGDLLYVSRVVRLCRRFPVQAVLTFTHKPNIFGVFAAALLWPRPFIVQLVEGLGYSFIDIKGPRKRLANLMATTLYRLSLRLSNQVFFLNDDDLTVFREKELFPIGLKVGKIDGIGVDLRRFQFSSVSTEVFSFLMIARLLRTKGVGEYCSAARSIRQRHPTIRFTLVGAEDPSHDGFTRQELQPYIDDKTIHWVPESNEVEKFYRECAVYVLPSYREGVPVTVMEAMATGRPVITTDVPGCRTTVTNGMDGLLVPAKNVDALVEAMSHLFNSPGLVKRLGAAARETAERRFDDRVLSARQADALEQGDCDYTS